MSAAKSIPSASRIHEGPQTVPHATLLSAVSAAAAEQAVSNETHRAYGRALRQVTEQLAGRTLDDQGLSEALSELVAEGAGRSKLSQIVAAVRFGARLAGQPDPVGPSCDVVLRAHRRAAPPARQVAAVDWEHADAAADAAASTGDAIGLRNAAVIAVMSDALLRVSETAALQVGDVKCRHDGAATLTVPRSKTDRYGDRATLYLGATTIRRIKTWTSAANAAGTEIARSRPAVQWRGCVTTLPEPSDDIELLHGPSSRPLTRPNRMEPTRCGTRKPLEWSQDSNAHPN